MSDSALSGIKVIEYSQEISGPYCARQLADFGAEVIKVEDIGGDSSRKTGPFPGDVPDIEQSGLFLAVNTNKFGMTLNLKDRTGCEVFKELIHKADVLVENNQRTTMPELGLDYETLHQLNPRLIYVSVTPFGHTGCYRDYVADELVLSQMSGIGYYTPGDADEPHQPPLRAGVRLSDVSAGTCAATATMFALLQRESSGEGQHIDVASRETPMFAGIYNMALYFYERQKPTRFGGKMPREPSRILPCKDGYIHLECQEEHQWRAFVKLIGSPDWSENELFKDGNSRAEYWDALEPLVLEETRKWPKAEISRFGQEIGVPCAAVNTPGNLLDSYHLSARDFFPVAEHLQAGLLQYPGAPFKMGKTPWRMQRTAPLLGQHNEDILTNWLGYSKEKIEFLRHSGII